MPLTLLRACETSLRGKEISSNRMTFRSADCFIKQESFGASERKRLNFLFIIYTELECHYLTD